MSAVDLAPDSITALRLQHATPEHLHRTSQRLFIGPIPEGWLKSHRRDWYTHHLHINYSSKAATFSANANVSRLRRLTGLTFNSSDAPPPGPSFPQPEDVREEPEDGSSSAASVQEHGAGLEVPRASNRVSTVTTLTGQTDGETSGLDGGNGGPASDLRSTASLLPNRPEEEVHEEASHPVASPLPEAESTTSLPRDTRRRAHFDLPNVSKRSTLQLKVRNSLARSSQRRRFSQSGEVVKVEKMLVRVDTTAKELPKDYDENYSEQFETRVVEKWREYMVACRESDDDTDSMVLQMYKSRVGQIHLIFRGCKLSDS